ncbi:MAG: Wzz/FepE/Etk N-terminal domain-containing protein [Sphingomonadales bacterium]
MSDVYEQVLTMLYSVWRKRWYGLAAMWVVCIIGWGVVAYIPDRYRSEARIYVDTNTLLQRLVNSVDTNPLKQVEVMRRTLVSRPNLEKVIHRVDLDLTIDDDSEMDNLITDLQNNISLRSQGTDLFWIAYETGRSDLSDQENAELARRVVQNLLTIFFEGNLGVLRNTLSETRRFIDEQLADYERQLELAERRRAEFERKYIGWLPGDQNFLARLRQAQTELEQTNVAIKDANVVRTELQRQLSSLSPRTEADGGPMAGPYAQRYFGMQQQLDALYLRGFTDAHPDVIAVQRQMEALRKQAQSAGGSDTAVSGGVGNPVYEDIRIKLVDVETRLASLNNRKAKLEADIQELSKSAEQVPNIEAERARLNRDYEVIKNQFEQLLRSREEARLVQDVDTKTDKVQFRIIDPPQVPLKPSAPNRPLLLGGVLAGGLAAGIAFAFVIAHLHTTYPTIVRLRQAVGYPVLGAISAVRSEQQKRQRFLEISAFGLVLSALFVTCGLLILVEMTQTIIAT